MNALGQASLLIGAERLMRIDAPASEEKIRMDEWTRASAELPGATQAALGEMGLELRARRNESLAAPFRDGSSLMRPTAARCRHRMSISRVGPMTTSLRQKMFREMEQKEIFEQAKRHAFEYADNALARNVFPTDEAIGNWTASKDKHDVMHLLQAGGVACGAVYTTREIATDPHHADRGFFNISEHPQPVGPRPHSIR